MKKSKETILYTLTLQGEQVEGPANLAFYDVIKDGDFYSIRSYGVCAVATTKTLGEAIEYIKSKSQYVLDKRDIREKRKIFTEANLKARKIEEN